MQEIEEKISLAGYKITNPRRLVLRQILSAQNPISAQDIFKKIKKVDQVSVYRVLSLFEELKIVTSEIINKEKVYCLFDEPHHHIICRSCGDIKKIECKHDFGHYKNFKDIEHRLTLTGICIKCAN